MSERLRTLRHCIFTGRGRNGERQLLRWFPAETFAAGLPLPSAHSVRSHLPQGDGFSGDGNVYFYHKRRPLGEAGFAKQRLRGFVPFSSIKTTLWFAIFALAWYNSRINYCVYGKLGNRVEWQRKNENQRNGVLLPAVKRQNSGSRQGLAPCLAACC